jgi:hypothetical protein
MFLFAEETDVPAGEKYSFQPYNFGPMSSDIYTDLDELVARGLYDRYPDYASESLFRPRA